MTTLLPTCWCDGKRDAKRVVLASLDFDVACLLTLLVTVLQVIAATASVPFFHFCSARALEYSRVKFDYSQILNSTKLVLIYDNHSFNVSEKWQQRPIARFQNTATCGQHLAIKIETQ